MNDIATTTSGTLLVLGPSATEDVPAEARKRMATEGKAGLPLSTPQAAYVLNRSVAAVESLVQRKRLKRMPCGMFHPDELRRFMEARR